ncbi:DUF2955 domain-containing protein [Ferrimonas sediminicola]|uniref:DUF2955 domain-containing protein n=1 Tax=Ferrimonas sediminicola TaxID=2569538 RepID=A0A4U1BA95_9GAMM|nr:DUF2955 domain-containing protein [Ferrimonas sediminicola]TKB47335.1 DUF2955 domain-containing protein [Ferrimonas sediminicola]
MCADPGAAVMAVESQRRLWRLTLGVGLTVALSAALSWPLAHLAPVLAAKFLIEVRQPGPSTPVQLLAGGLATVGIALVVSFGPTQYPLVFLPLLAGLMLWSYYLLPDPRWSVFATLLLIASLLLPYMGIQHPGLTLAIAAGLVASSVVAVLVFALMHLLIPVRTAQAPRPAALPSSSERVDEALRALMLAFPLVCFFYLVQVNDALLIMIFVAILSLQASGIKSVQLSRFLLLTNAAGGALAVGVYQLLTILPQLWFYVALVALVTLALARKMVAEPAKEPIFAGVLTALLVVVGSSAASAGSEVLSSFYFRLLQILMVGAYMVFISYFLESRSRSRLREPG